MKSYKAQFQCDILRLKLSNKDSCNYDESKFLGDTLLCQSNFLIQKSRASSPAY